MVQSLKTHTLSIPQTLYTTLHDLAARQQRTPTEILTIALNLLTVALPRASQINPKLFQLPPRRSPPASKP